MAITARERACPPLDFSTVLGPLDSLSYLNQAWGDVSRNFRAPIDPPIVLPVPASAGLESARSLRVAEVRHANVSARQVVEDLTAAFARLDVRDATAEEGYFYVPDVIGSRQTNRAWSVRLNEDRVGAFAKA